MNNEMIGSTESWFIVGKKNGETFAVTINGFTATRAMDIQRAKWYDSSTPVLQMVSLLNTFAMINGDSTVFEGRKQLVEYTRVAPEETE